MTTKPGHAALVLLVLVGCVTSNTIHPKELTRLDGYQAAQVVPGGGPVLETLVGDKVVMQPDANLFLDVPGTRMGGRFDSIRVRDGVFQGRTADGGKVEVALDQLTRAQVEQPTSRTTAMIFGGSVLVMILGGLAVYSYVSWYRSITTVDGRALRLRGKLVAAPVAVAPEALLAAAEGWRAPGILPNVASLSLEARRALAVVWTDRARAEHASVPAFARLSLTLMAFGAPERLVRATHAAALEEIEHARLSFALASAYAGAAVAPGPIAELRGAPAVTVSSLPELAEESLVDGCLMEGAAAAAAGAALAAARDPAVRAALTVIVRDESSHAALAWEVVSWCLATGSAGLRSRLLKRLHRTHPAAIPVAPPAHLAPELCAHGWLPAAAWRDLFDRTRVEVGARLAVRFAESSQRGAA